MFDTALRFEVFGATVYGYGAALALGALISMAVMYFSLKRQHEQARLLPMTLFMLPSALIGARLLYCICIIEFLILENDIGFVYRLWNGGYLMYGAIFGCAVGLWAYSRVSKRPFSSLANAAAPACAAMIAVARAGECMTGAGVGWAVENESLQFFPIAVMNEWGDWRYAVFVLEALVAAGLCAYLIWLQRKGRRTVTPFLIVYAAAQLLLESLRKDDVMSFGFVKASMLFSALTLTGIVIYWLIKRVKGAWLSLAELALGCGAVIALEFALDKSTMPNEYVYLMMAVVVGLLIWVLLRRNGEKERREAL